MADYAKRPEITVSTMGKVHNPTGAGVPVKAAGPRPGPERHHHHHTPSEHETKVKEEGSARRNITRKKTDSNFDNSKKKQGGAGKGKWNDNDYLEEVEGTNTEVTNKDDPLYDDEGGSFILSSTDAPAEQRNGYDPNLTAPIYGPLLTLPEFKHRISTILKEYFDSNDIPEFLLSLNELKCPEYHSEVIKRAISLSCDAGPREREAVCRLFTEIHPQPLSQPDVETGFENVLQSMQDLLIDIPDANSLVGSFLARAVVDEVLPPAFLTTRRQVYEEQEEFDNCTIEIAIRLLSREHCTARLEKVWGPGDGRPVEELKQDIDQLLKEYLLSNELDEAARCVRELNAPHFHHELIKRGIITAMEEDGTNKDENNLDAMSALYAFLVSNSIVSEIQLYKGIEKVRGKLSDVTLDVPSAPVMLGEFEEMLKEKMSG